VSPDGKTVVLDVFTGGRSDLWTARLDGSGLQQLTDDAYVDRNPVWVGNDSVAFQSNARGQLDLWRVSVATRRLKQLTSSQNEEIASDGSADGGTIAFEQLSHSNSLWRLDVASGGTRQLTGDALGDYWPSVSESAGRIVFQRTRPTPQEGFQFLDAQVFTAPLDASSLDAQPVGDGFDPRLSPDGTWVAYYQRLPGLRSLRVLAKNLGNGETRTLSDRGTMPAITATGLPVDRVGQTMAWSPRGANLFYLALSDAGPEVHRVDLGSPGPPAVVARGGVGSVFRDLYVSPEGNSIAWIASAKETLTVEVVDLPANSRSFPAIKREVSAQHYLAGWTSETSLLMLRTERRGTEYQVELNELSPGGSRTVAVVADAPVPAVHVDPQRRRVLLTRNEGGVHNIYAVSLRAGVMTKITNNEMPGVSFSGIQSLRADAVVFAREERKRDVWLVQRKPVN
jgi:Tol biopolymer transport system component